MGDISNTIIDMINTKLTVTNKKQLQIVFFRLYAGSHDCFEVDYWFWHDPIGFIWHLIVYWLFSACDCNYQGSAQTQCDRRSGQCVCLLGISGYKCDRCDRGTTGELPNCKPCGDCFNNWDRVIRDLSGMVSEGNIIFYY